MKSLFIFCFVIPFQINIYSQLSNDSSSIVISPIIYKVVTDGCWNDFKLDGQFRIIITCEGIDHIYNRIFFQRVFLDPETFRWQATSLEEIKIKSEEDESIIRDALLYCEDGLTYLEFNVQNFWSENSIEKYKLILTNDGYSFINY